LLSDIVAFHKIVKRFYSDTKSLTQMSGTQRSNIKVGINVQVVQKQDQRTGKLTEGVVKDILTKSPKHPHGIKVRLTSGVIGRVKYILSE